MGRGLAYGALALTGALVLGVSGPGGSARTAVHEPPRGGALDLVDAIRWAPSPAHGSRNDLCPLSMEQQQRAADAFEKLAETFLHPRCANCHGALDITDAKSHVGFAMSRAEASEVCQECHSGLPGWTVPVPSMSFRTPFEICRRMKLLEPDAQTFRGHLLNDNGGTPFTETAFRGDRGLNEVGQDLFERERKRPFTAEPPPISHAEFMAQADAWLEAMGGEFVGLAECGCAPLKLELVLESRMQGGAGTDRMWAHVRATVPLTDVAEGQDLGRAPLEHLDYGLKRLDECKVTGSGSGGAVRVVDLQITMSGEQKNLAFVKATPPEIEVTIVPENSNATLILNCPYIGTMTLPGLQWAQQWRFVHDTDRREQGYVIDQWKVERSFDVPGDRSLIATRELKRDVSRSGVRVEDDLKLELWWVK